MREEDGRCRDTTSMMRINLDEDGCVSLMSILRVLDQLEEEQAWAICHELAILISELQSQHDCASSTGCMAINDLEQIKIHQEGYVHKKSLTSSSYRNIATTTASEDGHNNQDEDHNSANSAISSPETTATTTTEAEAETEDTQLAPTTEIVSDTQQVVASLGIALFAALDHGIPPDEERQLSAPMEYFILQSHQYKLNLDEVLSLCVNRLPYHQHHLHHHHHHHLSHRNHHNQLAHQSEQSMARAYYRNICQTLVRDAIELSTFLEKIYIASLELGDIALNVQANEHHHHLIADHSESLAQKYGHHLDLDLDHPLISMRVLGISNWARLWKQVIRELSQRDQFKQALVVNL